MLFNEKDKIVQEKDNLAKIVHTEKMYMLNQLQIDFEESQLINHELFNYSLITDDSSIYAKKQELESKLKTIEQEHQESLKVQLEEFDRKSQKIKDDTQQIQNKYYEKSKQIESDFMVKKIKLILKSKNLMKL